MHLLTNRSGELVSLVEPLCDDPGCPGCAGLVGLDSARRVELATVADRPDMGATELVSALVAFLKRTYWADKDPEVIAEYALDMAAVCTEVARSYPLGTKVRAAFDRDTEGWTITRANQCDSNPPTGPPKASPLPATAASWGRWAVTAAVVGGVVVVAAVVSVLAVVGHLSSHTHAAQASHQVSYSSQVELPFTGLNDPSGVEVDGAGDVYVADSRNNRVVKLSQASGAQTVLPFTGLNGPIGVAVDTNGAVYVVDTGNNRVVKSAQGSGAQTVLPFTGLNNPASGIALDGAGDVYVADSRNNRVVKLAQASGVQTVLPFTGLNDPYGVAVDSAGTVYVADFNNNRVVKLPPQ
jgi:hypothetical protein